ncbi:CU044_5270 family protein [Micromonospora chokoriensis]|uniref:CU044_5270 family protein n=1 Tax=Micromonospora chokoriensis TaxID=356851 RepID=UPI0004C38A3E|nr:CU044_5270 family protein [Micromonospora chokoriensis]
MKSLDDVRQLLGGLDPARDVLPADEERRAADLARILATDRAGSSGRRVLPRRRLVLAAGAAVLTTAAGVVALEMAREPQPAWAVTPAMLTYGPPVTTERADVRLRRLAEVAAAQPATPRPVGTVEHLESTNWFLNSSISGGRTTSAVVPQQWRSWRTDDNAGRRVKKDLPPIFRSDADRKGWQRRGGRVDSSRETTDYAAGEFTSRWQGAVPTDVAALREWFIAGGSPPEAPVQYLEDIAELAGVRLLGPAQRATTLRLLADLPGITVTGTVTDRAGRAGEAFSITSSAHGLPAQYTVIIDTDSGALLGYEEMLTTTAGMLNVTIPAVITYRSYLVAEYAPLPG